MNKDLKCEKDELSLKTLDKVTGGVRDSFALERFQAYWDEKMNENDITKVPDIDNPHSKKEKGKLYRWS